MRRFSIFVAKLGIGMTILFDEIVFGPVKSRRFGVSLGVNLLPVDFKYCTFNCIYCECGWTNKMNGKKASLPSRNEIQKALEERLIAMKADGSSPDHITFAGNGEPTIHPEFEGIIDDTIALRNRYFKKAEVTVLSNASLLHKNKVFRALSKVDNNVLKIDSAIEKTFKAINQPASGISLDAIIRDIKKFEGNQVVQTLFLRGEYEGEYIDNTSEEEVKAWIDVIKEVNPKFVMIYPVERDTAASGIEKVPLKDLQAIAAQVEKSGIKTKLYY